jgi:outer membrane protein assembly factor BamD
MTLKKLHVTAAVLLAVLAGLTFSCSAPQVKETPPEERLAQVRTDIKKRRYEMSQKTLEELKLTTAGTRIGGEVQFLLAETQYFQGDMAEAGASYETYLLSYPGGPFTEKALFHQALTEAKQIEKVRLGFLSVKRYIPHDRDVSILRKARTLFQRYLQTYPDGEWAQEADGRVTELLTKEGEHELEIVSFYLRKDEPRAALARARRVLEGQFPDPIQDRARELARKAEMAIPRPEEESSK